MQTKTSRLIFPFDKSWVGIFPYLNIYSPVASACAGVRFFQNDRVWRKVIPGWDASHTLRGLCSCCSHVLHEFDLRKKRRASCRFNTDFTKSEFASRLQRADFWKSNIFAWASSCMMSEFLLCWFNWGNLVVYSFVLSFNQEKLFIFGVVNLQMVLIPRSSNHVPLTPI